MMSGLTFRSSKIMDHKRSLLFGLSKFLYSNFLFRINIILCALRMQCSFSDFYLQGYGTNFYSYNEYFEGEWYADKRSGWGRMYYTDGSVYEGEWYNDLRNGEGMLRLGN